MKVLTDPLKPNTIEFDFLGKDSVQYQKEVEVHPAVYKNISNWIGKTASDRRTPPPPPPPPLPPIPCPRYLPT